MLTLQQIYATIIHRCYVCFICSQTYNIFIRHLILNANKNLYKKDITQLSIYFYKVRYFSGILARIPKDPNGFTKSCMRLG